MLGVKGEIDKPNHSAVGLSQLDCEVLRLDTPESRRTCTEVRQCPLSIAFINRGLNIVDRSGLVVECNESYDGSVCIVKRYLPGINDSRIRAVR